LLDLTIRQPSVARLIHYDASNLFLELEYVGPDLSKFVDGEKMSQLSTDLQHRIWIDISGGLEYIHAQDIAHLDIKPQNILLSESNRAVLCDFELSVERVVKPVYCDGGTPCYIPPEYLLDEKRGIPGDIWAFGVTMLFVFGLMPLPRGNWKIADICRNEGVHKEMFDWLNKLEQIEESIPEALSLLRQMLERNPTKRITASKLASDLLVMPQIKSVAAELIV
jgi:serine/threonine protein kinase